MNNPNIIVLGFEHIRILDAYEKEVARLTVENERLNARLEDLEGCIMRGAITPDARPDDLTVTMALDYKSKE
jgi:cell division protein FtsB